MKYANHNISGISQEFGDIIKQLIEEIDSDVNLTPKQKTELKFYLINNNIRFLQELFRDGTLNSNIYGIVDKTKVKQIILQKIND
jgi:hypothetical protein